MITPPTITEHKLEAILDGKDLHIFHHSRHVATLKLPHETQREFLHIDQLRDELSAREAEEDNRIDQARIEEILMQERVRKMVATLDG